MHFHLKSRHTSIIVSIRPILLKVFLNMIGKLIVIGAHLDVAFNSSSMTLICMPYIKIFMTNLDPHIAFFAY